MARKTGVSIAIAVGATAAIGFPTGGPGGVLVEFVIDIIDFFLVPVVRVSDEPIFFSEFELERADAGARVGFRQARELAAAIAMVAFVNIDTLDDAGALRQDVDDTFVRDFGLGGEVGLAGSVRLDSGGFIWNGGFFGVLLAQSLRSKKEGHQ